jgi:biotin transport system ATP-binding protein
MEENERKKIFSLRNISKVFSNGARVLNGVNLDIAEGECMVIAGANGSGKTLLMRIALGLLEPTEGEVFFQEKILSQADNLRKIAGMVFQDADAQIIGETVAEDTAFGPKNQKLAKAEIEARTRDALYSVGLWEKKEYPPRRLSGGEKRRLAVAGVLAMGCSAIIMDEPFANLDWIGVVQVLEIVKKMKDEGKTLVILTHELEKVLAFADRLVILDKGVIRDNGGCETVLNRLIPAYGVRDPRQSYHTVKDCSWLN